MRFRTISVFLAVSLLVFAPFSCATRAAAAGNAESSLEVVKAAEQPAAAATAAAGVVNLDAALGDFSAYIAGRLPDGTLTVVAVTEAPAQRLGNYAADELTGSLFNNTKLRMISRRDFERILAEQDIQASGNFNDDTTAKIGHNLGWQTIIFAGVEPLRETYRLSLRAVNVETGELQGSKTYMLNGNDPVLISLVNPSVTVQRLDEREKILEPFKGKQNDFQLNVTANKTVYYDNEELQISLNANADCYFVVYHLDIDNNMQIIFPNKWERDTNFLKAGATRLIPEGSRFVLHAPYGEERILVYASAGPIDIPDDQYRSRSISKDDIAHTQTVLRNSRGLSVAPRGATGQFVYSILPGR